MTGQVIVDVPLGAIKLRGEKNAVTAYAFGKLMGEDELGKVIDKRSPTREFLQIERQSRYLENRGDVYQIFEKKIRFKAICNVIR
jgi:hypothetical protein